MLTYGVDESCVLHPLFTLHGVDGSFEEGELVC